MRQAGSNDSSRLQRRIFDILKVNKMMPFRNLFAGWPLSSHDQISWLFHAFSRHPNKDGWMDGFQVITYGALTFITVAIKNEMHVISWHFY